jgi:hypothetical protein
MKKIAFLILVLFAPSIVRAVDFTVILTTTNAHRAAAALQCTGTNQQKLDCVLDRIKDFLRERVKAFEGGIEGNNAYQQKIQQVQQDFTFQ